MIKKIWRNANFFGLKKYFKRKIVEDFFLSRLRSIIVKLFTLNACSQAVHVLAKCAKYIRVYRTSYEYVSTFSGLKKYFERKIVEDFFQCRRRSIIVKVFTLNACPQAVHVLAKCAKYIRVYRTSYSTYVLLSLWGFIV